MRLFGSLLSSSVPVHPTHPDYRKMKSRRSFRKTLSGITRSTPLSHNRTPALPGDMEEPESLSGSEMTLEQEQKRKYSRNGCAECKRRRMKCDETKPSCWQCSRLGRECVYLLKKKNKKRRTKAEIEQERVQRKPEEQASEFTFSTTDANLLYNDLNDLVNWRLEEALTPNLKTYIEESTNPFATGLKDHNLPLSTDDKTQIIFDVPLRMFVLGEPHDEYMKRFYNEFTTLLCPFVPNVDQNPVRDVLLNYSKIETYLLYAILACGAMTEHRHTKQIRDDQAYCTYLSTCLNILSDNFQDENLIQAKVEPMLLTILLLTTDCATNKNLRWRAHLKGAKELLKKTTVQSDTLNFCRNWLITYEVLAGMTNSYGGIFQSDPDELDDFLTNDELYLNSLKRFNMIDVHGFNYISGHIIQLDIAYKDIMIVLNRIRRLQADGLPRKKSHLDYDMTSAVEPPVITMSEWHSISNQLDNLEAMAIIDKTGVIPPSNPNHPSHNKVTGFDAIDTVVLPSGELFTLSWFDIIHQTHIIAARIVFLVSVLEFDRKSILVQELVTKGLDFIRFFNDVPLYRNSCMTHLHLMTSIAGKYAIQEEDQKLVELFLNAAYDMGLASAQHNLIKLRRIWKNEVQSDEEDEDILTW